MLTAPLAHEQVEPVEVEDLLHVVPLAGYHLLGVVDDVDQHLAGHQRHPRRLELRIQHILVRIPSSVGLPFLLSVIRIKGHHNLLAAFRLSLF